MITYIREKLVKIRKPHYCFACYRKKFPGAMMHAGVYADEDGIYTLHTCEMCKMLMDTKKEYFYDEVERVFPAGCVHNAFYYERLPEDLEPYKEHYCDER